MPILHFSDNITSWVITMKTDNYYSFEYNEVKFKDKFLFPGGALTIPANSISLVIGKNGTGKSTLLKQLHYRYGSCIYVSQKPDQILHDLTVLDNLTMCQPSISVKYVKDVLEKLELTNLLDHSSSELSGGEQKIICILRAFFANNRVILLDEPTNDLDYRTVNKIIDILIEFKSERTILIVTHDERLYPLADTIYRIDNNLIHTDCSSIRQLDQAETDLDDCLKDEKLIKTVIQPDIGRQFCIILILIIGLTSIFKFASILSQKINPLSDKQVIFCNTLYDTSSNLLSDGFLPTAFLELLDNDTDIWDIKDSLDQVIVNATLEPYNLNLSLPDNQHVTYYDLIFYDPSTNTIINILDCCEDIECSTVLSDYFTLPGKLKSYNNLPFSNTIYRKAIANIKQLENLELVLSIAVLDSEIDFFEYIADDYFAENLKANYYVCSNETIALVQTAMQLNEIKFVGQYGLAFLAISCLLMVFNTVLINILRKPQSEILRDYGYSFDDINCCLSANYSIQRLFFPCSALVLLNVVVTIVTRHIDVPLLYLPTIVTFLAFILVCYVEKIITVIYQKKIFSFGGVFHDF